MIEVSRQSYTVIEGRELQIPCRTQGVPRPEVLWAKNGEAIDPNDYRFRVLHDGRLAIPITRYIHKTHKSRFYFVIFSECRLVHHSCQSQTSCFKSKSAVIHYRLFSSPHILGCQTPIYSVCVVKRFQT